VSDTRTTPIGDGTVDWPGVFAAARAAPVHSYFVEMEAPFAQPPLQGLEKSADYLRKLSI
jgi:sugar phosphate isomerase/epimerase